jgi:hypothetical protein
VYGANAPRRRIRIARPARLIATAALLCGPAAGLAACGSSASPAATRPASSSRAPGAHRLSARVVARLSQPVSGEALLAGDGALLVLGGLDALDESTDSVVRFTPGTARATHAGALAEPKHDLAAAALGTRQLVFGGGSASELDSVERLTSAFSAVRVGTLPSARSDLAAVTVGPSVYVLGGYDGSHPLAEVVRTQDGRSFHAAGTLVTGVRYGAVAAVGSTVYCFGGELAGEGDSDAIQAFDTRTGTTRVVGRLPAAVSHASAVALGASIYVLGGSSHGVALRRILEYNTATGRLRAAGRLPLAVKNGAAIGLGSVAYLVGGIGTDGATLATIVAVGA